MRIICSRSDRGNVCGFFNPSMETVMPVIVDEDNLVRANSIFDMLISGAEIIGQTAGGILYGIFSGPVIFLFNGISYLFSAGTENFIYIIRYLALQFTHRCLNTERRSTVDAALELQRLLYFFGYSVFILLAPVMKSIDTL